MVSKRVPRGGGLSVVLPGNSGPGRSIVALGETEVILRLEEELSARENHPRDVFHAGDAFPVLAAGSRIVILVDEDALMPRCG